MNREEAEVYAKNMSYRDAVYNALQGKCIPYRKATLIKLYELLDIVEPQEGGDVLDEIRAEIDAARFLDKDKKLFKNANASGLKVAMDIIDRYMAEGSGE